MELHYPILSATDCTCVLLLHLQMSKWPRSFSGNYNNSVVVLRAVRGFSAEQIKLYFPALTRGLGAEVEQGMVQGREGCRTGPLTHAPWRGWQEPGRWLPCSLQNSPCLTPACRARRVCPPLKFHPNCLESDPKQTAPIEMLICPCFLAPSRRAVNLGGFVVCAQPLTFLPVFCLSSALSNWSIFT